MTSMDQDTSITDYICTESKQERTHQLPDYIIF